MMAVDSKQGGTTVPATGTPHAGTQSPAATLAGMPAVTATNGKHKRKRPSSLLAAASALPSVENSLDEFIARANETLVDTDAFNAAATAEKNLKQEDEKRREQDQLRWKATEQQMRESQAREESLRRQLDGLQGKLAEAEARAAVASAGGTQDGIIADLKMRLTAADDRVRLTEERAKGAEERASQLATELVATKAAAAALPATPPERISFHDTDDLEQRLRVAEAKATKAIAVAKAAAAGLSINPADITAIESGLVVPMESGNKGTNWGLVFAALLVGGAVAFAAAFVFLKQDAPKAAASVAPAVQPQTAAPAPASAAPAKPTVTPIEEPAAAQPEAPAAPAAEAKVAAPEAKTEAPSAPAAKEEPVEPKAAKKASAPAKKTAKKAGGGLADPFGGGEAAAPAPAKKEKKAAKKSNDTGLVNPF